MQGFCQNPWIALPYQGPCLTQVSLLCKDQEALSGGQWHASMLGTNSRETQGHLPRPDSHTDLSICSAHHRHTGQADYLWDLAGKSPSGCSVTVSVTAPTVTESSKVNNHISNLEGQFLLLLIIKYTISEGLFVAPFPTVKVDCS